MYWDHMSGWGWLMMIVWSLISLGFLGLIAWLAVQWTQTSSLGTSPSEPSAKTARELLDERLARGEINLDEYERRANALDRHAPVGV
jgi:putative membrane protein